MRHGMVYAEGECGGGGAVGQARRRGGRRGGRSGGPCNVAAAGGVRDAQLIAATAAAAGPFIAFAAALHGGRMLPLHNYDYASLPITAASHIGT